jgi:hypothetical protein
MSLNFSKINKDKTNENKTNENNTNENNTNVHNKLSLVNTLPLTISSVLSAGFLFYSVPPNSNDIYFLLGMDSYSGKWCDFGGR